MSPPPHSGRKPDPNPGPPGTAIDPRPVRRGEAPLAVLCFHGLTGTPYEVRPITDALADRGFAVRAPLLPGHDSLEALERSTWREWYDFAEAAFDALYDGGRRRVLVIGFSMGSLLALRLASLRPHDPAGVVGVSVPLQLEDWKRHAVLALARLRQNRFLHGLVGRRDKSGGRDVRIRREAEAPALDAFPYPTLAEFVALQEEVRELLPNLVAPLLLLHGQYDHVTPPEASARVAQMVSSPRVERTVYPSSFHQLALDLDRDAVCRRIVEFAVSVLGEPTPASAPDPAADPTPAPQESP